MLYAVGETSI